MENLQQLPSLSFNQALRLASRRLLDFKGRSRRSEFWWWMLCVLIVNEIIGLFTSSNLNVSMAMNCMLMAFALAVTVRRVQDTGHSGLWVWLSYVAGIVSQVLAAATMGDFIQKAMNGASQKAIQKASERLVEQHAAELGAAGLVSIVWLVLCIVVIVFCLMDGRPEANKYGDSPKYIIQ